MNTLLIVSHCVKERNRESGCTWSIEIEVTHANNILITAADVISMLYFKIFADIENGGIYSAER